MIRLQFSFEADLASHLITLFSHGAGYSHVDIVRDDETLLGARNEVCAGVPSGVQVRPPDYARFARRLVVDLIASNGEMLRFNDFAHAQIGKPYDMRAILGFASGRDWRTREAWFCSELIASALEECGYFTGPLATPAGKIDPDDLLLALSAAQRIDPFDPGPVA